MNTKKTLCEIGLFLLLVLIIIFVLPTQLKFTFMFINKTTQIMEQLDPIGMFFGGRVNDATANRMIKEHTDFCLQNPTAAIGNEKLSKKNESIKCSDMNQVLIYQKDKKLIFENRTTGEILFKEI